MTVATCPSCGHAQSVFAVFIRYQDDLVCQSCRDSLTATRRNSDGGVLPPNSPPRLSPPPRRRSQGKIL